jgi:hypothetical protein
VSASANPDIDPTEVEEVRKKEEKKFGLTAIITIQQ